MKLFQYQFITGGQGPRGTVEDFFLEINCKERVHIILWELVLALFQRLLYQRQRPKLLKGGWAGVEIHTWAGRKCWKPVTTSLRKKTACLDALEVGRDALQWGNPLRDRKRPGAANLGPTCQENLSAQGTEEARREATVHPVLQQEAQTAGGVPSWRPEGASERMGREMQRGPAGLS